MGWEQLRPWLSAHAELPVGQLFCIIDGLMLGRPWSSAVVRRLAECAGVRRRFAPHPPRHAHALELAREGVPLNTIQRQLGTPTMFVELDDGEPVASRPGENTLATHLPWSADGVRKEAHHIVYDDGDRPRRARWRELLAGLEARGVRASDAALAGLPLVLEFDDPLITRYEAPRPIFTAPRSPRPPGPAPRACVVRHPPNDNRGPP